jgi:hypothetical protein
MDDEDNPKRNKIAFLLGIILFIIALLSSIFVWEYAGQDEDVRFLQQLEKDAVR